MVQNCYFLFSVFDFYPAYNSFETAEGLLLLSSGYTCCTSVGDPSQFWTETMTNCLSSGPRQVPNWHVSVLDWDNDRLSQFWTETI